MIKVFEKRGLTRVVVLVSSLVLIVSSMSAADADGRKSRGFHGGFYVGDGAAAAGIIGLAAGAILGSTLSSPRNYGPRYYGPGYAGGPVYYDPPPRYHRAPRYAPPRPAPHRYTNPRYQHPPRVYVDPRYAPPPARYRAAPFTPEWIAYCSRKYKSFNPRTGTYLAYSGKVRMCR